jgi:hypothetical protein
LLIYYRLCKAGYAKSVQEAKTMDAREVIQALAYEGFLNDYERVWLELNKK